MEGVEWGSLEMMAADWVIGAAVNHCSQSGFMEAGEACLYSRTGNGGDVAIELVTPPVRCTWLR